MSNKAIDYRILLKRDGQTQQQRMPQWLQPSLVPVDARTKEEFFDYLKNISKQVKFFDTDLVNENGDWQDFFDLTADELSSLAAKGALPPHIALWQTFISLYQFPQDLANAITKRHLDFYYGDVLRLKKKPPSPDKAHVVFELKKNTSDTLLKTGTSLLGGQDKSKKDRIYKLTHDIVVNNSSVAELKSLYKDSLNNNFIHFAPVANSADGLGAELDKSNPGYNAFGGKDRPLAQIGFCLASSVLKMKEGDRTITVNLTLNNIPESAKNTASTAGLFIISITGTKGWLAPKTVSPTVTQVNNSVYNFQLVFRLTRDEPAVSAYAADLHGNNFDTLHPVLQVLINNQKADFGSKDLAGCELLDATIEVEAKGIKELVLENDFGSLDAKKPFAPFGSTPEINANFTVGYEEAFSKRLKEFSFDVQWKNIPASDLSTYFSAYGTGFSNGYFEAIAGFKDGFAWEEKSTPVDLFNADNAQIDSKWTFTSSTPPVKSSLVAIPHLKKASYQYAGQPLQQKVGSQMAFLMPSFAPLKPGALFETAGSSKPNNLVKRADSFNRSAINITQFIDKMASPYKELQKGRFSLRLNKTFLFREYQDKYTAEVLRYSRLGGTLALPNQPFAPEILSITLNYTATTTKTRFDGTSLNDYLDEEIEFFHYGAFGQKREHTYLKTQQQFLTNTQVSLLPESEYEGSFFIGFSGLGAEDAASVLFQVAEGSANPEKPKVNIIWSVLCDNYWKALGEADFIFDTTNDLLTSGVIKIVIPREATTVNTIMPGGLLWLRASIKADSDAVCNIIDVKANAAVTQFEIADNDPSHLAAPLAANTITKLDPEIGTIKAVSQPYASFGGLMEENDDAYYIRVSERLRHKERSISNWDYERLILQHFPALHKVKCINHASDTSFYAPGHVLVIVVPDLTNQNAVDPLKPRADKNTLDRVYTFLTAHSSNWVTHHITNPYYEPVQISAAIKLKTGFEFNYYQNIIDKKLQEYFSPWISSNGGSIHFGRKVTHSMIVKFLEEMEFVDFIVDLKLYHSLDGGLSFKKVEVVEASNPASVLVSHFKHLVSNY
ncbi:hypothetical protein GZH53_19095 [Flavihumibacter sp. R14]|nr:hypothetical protein [Flavihumibacter soli]